MRQLWQINNVIYLPKLMHLDIQSFTSFLGVLNYYRSDAYFTITIFRVPVDSGVINW